MCTSQNGIATAANASRIATEVCVNAPGLMMMNRVPSALAACGLEPEQPVLTFKVSPETQLTFEDGGLEPQPQA